MARITRRAVDALTAREREYMLWDHDVKGFGVRVHPSGRKVYIVKYRHHGRVVKKTIGPHGAIPPAAARARAAEIITAARTGRDLAGRDSAGEGCDGGGIRSTLPCHRPCGSSPGASWKNTSRPAASPGPRTATTDRSRGTCFPGSAKRRVMDVTRSDVATLHHDMRTIPYAANHTLGILSTIFTAAEVWGLRPEGSNPCRHVKRFRVENRERFLSDEEYRRLGAALRRAEKTGTEAASAVAAIRLLMLTGCRLSEIMTLRWENVDPERPRCCGCRTARRGPGWCISASLRSPCCAA